MASPGVPRPDTYIYFPAHSPNTPAYVDYGSGWVIQVGSGFWSCLLRQGSSGEGVRSLQAQINQCYYPLGISGPWLAQDGDYGPRTAAAVARVQAYHRITADGVYGSVTARTIWHDWAEFRSPYATGCSTLAQAGWPGNSG